MSGLKPITLIIDKFMNMIKALLSPLLMVVTLLLIPILKLIKPIAMIANKVMKPFLKLAMETIKGGLDQAKESGDKSKIPVAMTAAVGIIMAGFSTVLLGFFKQTIDFIVKMFLTLMQNLLDPILSFLGIKTGDIGAKYQEYSDKAYNFLSDAIIEGAASLATPFVKETDSFVEEAKKQVRIAFTKDAGGVTSMQGVISEEAGTLETDMVDQIDFVAGKGKQSKLDNIAICGSERLKKVGTAGVNQIIKNAHLKASEIIENAQRKATGTSSGKTGEEYSKSLFTAEKTGTKVLSPKHGEHAGKTIKFWHPK